MSCETTQIEIPELPCYACQENKTGLFVEHVGAFAMLECPNCGLQYANPMSYSADDYDSSYSGSGDAFLKSYAASMEANRSLIKKRDYFNGHDSKEKAFRYVKSSLSRDSPILDLGCGAGAFLAALTEAGFVNVMGMDVAKIPIELLSQDGYEVARGTLKDYPNTWPAPKAVLMIEVLEHLPNPVETMIEVRTRFPDATLIVTVPSPDRIMLKYGTSFGDRPPNHLTRWTQHALSEALRSAGYHGFVRPGPLRGHLLKLPLEDEILNALRRLRKEHVTQTCQQQQHTWKQAGTKKQRILLSTVAKLVAKYQGKRGRRDFRRIKNIVLFPLACYFRLIGYTGHSLVAVGVPSVHFDSQSVPQRRKQ